MPLRIHSLLQIGAAKCGQPASYFLKMISTMYRRTYERVLVLPSPDPLAC